MTETSTRTLRIGLILFAALAPMAIVHAGGDQPPEPAGYWQGPMKSKVPATITGGTVIGTDNLQRLTEQGKAVLVDVYPAPRRPSDQSTPWMPVAHRDIPRSVWIPGAGSGVVSGAMEDFLRRRLAELAGPSQDNPMVFYCRRDCWASWNAAKRAISLGYKSVNWYPGGVDAWQESGLPIETVEAEGPAAE